MATTRQRDRNATSDLGSLKVSISLCGFPLGYRCMRIMRVGEHLQFMCQSCAPNLIAIDEPVLDRVLR